MILDIDPTVDYAFKHLFGRDQTRPILANVIDSVLASPPERRIQEIDLLNPFNPKEALDDKLSILDIKARDRSGRQFNVEMQLVAFQSYVKRILYYWSKLHQQQMHEGQDYLTLQPTISISFLDHVLFPQVPDCHLRFYLRENAHGFSLTDDIEFHILQLPKFTKTAAELESDVDIWLYFLRHAAKIDTDAVPAALQRPLVLCAVEELKMLTQSDKERELYEARLKFQSDYRAAMHSAREEGRKEGQTEDRIAIVQLCERLLNRSETPGEQLARLPFAELSRLADELQALVRQQR